MEVLRVAAGVVAGRRVSRGLRALVVPGSFAVKQQAEAEGLDEVGLDLGRDRLGMRVAGNVGRVQERRALEPELDERGLHARQHARHLALVDVADEAAAIRALDQHLLEHAALDECGTHLARRRVDQDLLFHYAASRSPQSGTPQRSSSRAVSNRGNPTPDE